MAFGFSALNENGLLLFSDATYNLSFAGKATYTGQQAFWATNIGYFLANNFNIPTGELWYYSFNSGGADAIFLVHAPAPAFASVLTANRSGNTYSITVVAQPGGRKGSIPSSLIPQVYCFTKQTSAPNTGHGVNVFNSAGEVAFSSNGNPLIIKAVYDATYRASNLQVFRAADGPFNRVGNGPSPSTQYITTTGPLNTVGNISKPLVFFPNHESATMYTGGIYYFFEIGARFDNNTKALQTSWMCPFQVAAFSGTTYNRAQRVAYAFVADGADYD